MPYLQEDDNLTVTLVKDGNITLADESGYCYTFIYPDEEIEDQLQAVEHQDLLEVIDMLLNDTNSVLIEPYKSTVEKARKAGRGRIPRQR